MTPSPTHCCNCVKQSAQQRAEGTTERSSARVVVSRAFSLFFPCNHIINIKKKSFSGEVKDSVIFLFLFYFTRELNLYSPLIPILPPTRYWEASKWYFVNVERGNIADKLQPRNINVSFTNNSNVAIDVIIFTFYSDQIVIDVETGIVNK
jgi:hypothetical protein